MGRPVIISFLKFRSFRALFFVSKGRAIPLRGSHRVLQAIKKAPFKGAFLMAALHGFEPRLTESESAVLPLDDSAINL